MHCQVINVIYVTIKPHFDIHGFYALNSGQYAPRVTLLLRAKGYQYGYMWGEKSETVINISGEAMDRFDVIGKQLTFPMQVGADPFNVLVTATLRADAIGSGTAAVADFASGDGNKIGIPYVNTTD